MNLTATIEGDVAGKWSQKFAFFGFLKVFLKIMYTNLQELG